MILFKSRLTFLLSILIIQIGGTQSGYISFYQTDLETAIEIAKRQDKSIFVDTYAPWCKPCKEMEKEFRDKELSAYFNQNFVNLKVNMETEIGKDIHRKYAVIFLPTFLILDKNGRVKIIIDRLIKADNLLQIARQINEGYQPKKLVSVNDQKSSSDDLNKQAIAAQTSKVPAQRETTKNPYTGSTIAREEKEVIYDQATVLNEAESIGENEKILYVLGDGGDLPPLILKEEAYFRMKLMDGSHIEAAKKYLDTQLDWSTHDNIRFISDFLYTSKSKEFDYLIQNRKLFEKQLGYDKIARTINILVHSQLHQGYPRPGLSDAILLYSYVDPINYEPRAYEYYLDRLWDEEKYPEYKSIASSYLKNINDDDDQMLYRWVRTHSSEELTDPLTLNSCIVSLEKAVKINYEDVDYYRLLANLYFQEGSKKAAKLSAQKALDLAIKNDLEHSALELLLQRIEGM